MFYILDNLGYIEEVSTHYIERDNKTCTEYTGAIPEGYETLADWVLNANIRAYKITNGNLVYDANRDAALQAEYNARLLPNEFILYESTNGSNGNITLNDSVTNYKYIEILYRNNDSVFNSVKIETPNGKVVSLSALTVTGGVIYAKTKAVAINNNTISTKWTNGHVEYRIDGAGCTHLGTNNYIYITKVIGYK